jgi:hypothetical protein
VPVVDIVPAGVVLGGQAPVTSIARPPAHAPQLRGWLWLVLGMGSVLLWTHTLSLNSGVGEVLRWLPGLAIVAGLRFIWLNRSRRGLWILAAGAGCNFLVMTTNGGLMPISPSTARTIGLPVQQATRSGAVLSRSKDRVLTDSQAQFAYLDDRLVFRAGNRHIAASIGDGVVVLGIIVTLLEELFGAVGSQGSPVGLESVKPARRRFHGL